MVKPRFSIIIPTLNEEKFVSKLLTSLTKQTVKNFDVVVVDGLSKDRTVEVANSFRHKLPLTVAKAKKTGVSHQRNAGATIGKAEWLVFVDADSVLLPNFIERIGEFIHKKRPRFFTTWLRVDSDDAKEVIAGFMLNMSVEGSILIEKPWAPGPLTVIRRDIFFMVGGYDESASFGEDHDLALMVKEKGVSFRILREILYVYSLRRFRKEGNMKVFERNMKALFRVLVTGRGPKFMPDFIGGGGIYEKQEKKKVSDPLRLKKLERSIRNVIEEFIS